MLAVLCQDENMMKDAGEGKDLYTAVAAKAFHTTYEECLEHFPKDAKIAQRNGKWYYANEEEIKSGNYKLANGETDTYKEGKARRKQAKIILLGMMYSRGPAALAEQLECSLDEAKDIMNSVFNAFPNIKKCDIDSKEFAKKYGYTTTIWGRKRRLPDIKLPPYNFDFSNSIIPENQRENFIKATTPKLQEEYWNRNKKQKIIDDAEKKYKVKISDNSGFIAKAERQVLNARVQGSSADMTKKAIVSIFKNKRLRDLGFKLVVPIHDEILAMCPLAYAKECKELFVYEMEHAAVDKVPFDIKVDPVCSFEWYGKEIDVDNI